MFLGIIIKLGAVLLYSPIFAFPGLAVAFVGLWCGKTFVKAQLCVKREMSNARAPVLAHFGAAISSIGKFIYYVTWLTLMISNSFHTSLSSAR